MSCLGFSLISNFPSFPNFNTCPLAIAPHPLSLDSIVVRVSSTESLVFHMMPERHAPPFNDYGRFEFDPKLDFFQVLGEARRLRQHQAAATTASVRFKLQKPITKDQEKKKKKKTSRNKKPRWSWSSWRGALDLLFFKLKWPVHVDNGNGQPENPYRSRQLGHSASGPLYLAESRNTSKTRHRVSSRWGPLVATVPYVCLSPDFRSTVPPPPTTPLYLIT